MSSKTLSLLLSEETSLNLSFLKHQGWDAGKGVRRPKITVLLEAEEIFFVRNTRILSSK